MNILLKIFCAVLCNTVFANITVNAFNSKQLNISNVNNHKHEFQQIISRNISDGIKVVSNNNNKKREAQGEIEIENQKLSKPTQPKNKIKEIREESDGILNVVAEIEDDKAEIKILIFNMLGKEVRKIFQGIPTEKNEDGYYIFTTEKPLNLPKNAYILVIQGNTFRIADRFIVAR